MFFFPSAAYRQCFGPQVSISQVNHTHFSIIVAVILLHWRVIEMHRYRRSCDFRPLLIHFADVPAMQRAASRNYTKASAEMASFLVHATTGTTGLNVYGLNSLLHTQSSWWQHWSITTAISANRRRTRTRTRKQRDGGIRVCILCYHI